MLNAWETETGVVYNPLSRRATYNEIPAHVPEVECAFQLLGNSEYSISYNDKDYSNLEIHSVDSTFFKLFGINPIVTSESPFANQNSVLLSKSTAKRIFGKTDVIGEQISLAKEKYFITAVYNDIPKHTHFKADVLVPMPKDANNYQSLEFNTYFLIRKGANLNNVISKIEQSDSISVNKWCAPFGITMISKAEPLQGMHLFTLADYDLAPLGDIKLVMMVAGIALLILITALFNSINQFLATGQKRLKEMGIRRSSGATNKSIIKQLIFESALINLFALLISLCITIQILPYFSEILNREIPIQTLFSVPGIAMMIGVFSLSTLLSGIYPAYTLTRFNASQIFQKNRSNKSSSSWISHVMIITQLTAAILMLFTLSSINQHINFLKNEDLGLNPKNVIIFSSLDKNVSDNTNSIKQEVRALPGVISAGFSHHTMGYGYSGQLIRISGTDDRFRELNAYRAEDGFCEVFELNLLWGRLYRDSDKGDESKIILNKKAADNLGLKPNDTRRVDIGDWRTNVEVIGVVSDFAYEGNSKTIQPMGISNTDFKMNDLNVRYDSNRDETQLKAQIISIIHRYAPKYISNTIYPETIFENKYTQEMSVRRTVAYSGLIALFICLIGIYAITVFNLQKRLKELALRKIMGASVQSIQTLYLKKYIKQLLIAALIALPIGTIIMHEYFKNYPKHESINPLFYILSIVVPLIIICTIVAIRVLYTAKQNPVKSLRYE